MAIQYVKIKRMVSVGSNPGEKFQARIKRSQMIEEKDLCEEITQYHIVKHAKNGESVRLKELGIFYPAIAAKAVNTIDEVTPETITRKFLKYRQNVTTRKEMNDTPIKLANMQIAGLQS